MCLLLLVFVFKRLIKRFRYLRLRRLGVGVFVRFKYYRLGLGFFVFNIVDS